MSIALKLVDESKRRRRGPARLDLAVKRDHCVSVRLNDAELAALDAQRRAGVNLQRGEYLRMAALHRLPRVIPAPNRELWAELARVGANLNQIAKNFNEGQLVSLAETQAALDELRAKLIGAG